MGWFNEWHASPPTRWLRTPPDEQQAQLMDEVEGQVSLPEKRILSQPTRATRVSTNR